MECEHVLVSRSLVVVGGSCLGDNKKGQMDHLSRTLGHYPVSGLEQKQRINGQEVEKSSEGLTYSSQLPK